MNILLKITKKQEIDSGHLYDRLTARNGAVILDKGLEDGL